MAATRNDPKLAIHGDITRDLDWLKTNGWLRFVDTGVSNPCNRNLGSRGCDVLLLDVRKNIGNTIGKTRFEIWMASFNSRQTSSTSSAKITHWTGLENSKDFYQNWCQKQRHADVLCWHVILKSRFLGSPMSVTLGRPTWNRNKKPLEKVIAWIALGDTNRHQFSFMFFLLRRMIQFLLRENCQRLPI